MSKRMERQMLETNAMVMGGGVGLAALESMFNLVQSQSLLGASMVRHYDMAHNVDVQALSATINDLLKSEKMGGTGGGVHGSHQEPDTLDSYVHLLIAALEKPENKVDINEQLTEGLRLLSKHISELIESSQPVMLVT